MLNVQISTLTNGATLTEVVNASRGRELIYVIPQKGETRFFHACDGDGFELSGPIRQGSMDVLLDWVTARRKRIEKGVDLEA